MDNEIFYEYESSQYGDCILLNEYRREFSLVAATLCVNESETLTP